MILSGEKKEEYREIKKSMISIFFNWQETNYTRENFEEALKKNHFKEDCWTSLKKIGLITFSNGYAKDRRQMLIEMDCISIGKGKQEWGAKKDTFYFVLKLGEILKKNT